MSLRILLVEDNPDDADLLRHSLRERGATAFALTHVETLHDALQRLTGGNVDVVLLDLSLPDARGLKTLTCVLDAAPNVPVVVLTGLDDDAIGTGAVHAGAQDYLVKGNVDSRLLGRCVQYAIERHRLQQEKAAAANVSSALARVGEHLLHSLSTPVLVERLCRLTTEVLGCDFTHTWLWSAEEQAYVPVAHYGDGPEVWQAVRDLKISREAAADLIGVLGRDEVVQSVFGQSSDLIPPDVVGTSPRATTLLYMVIRRGSDVIGGQASGYWDGSKKFSSTQMRVAKGLVHLASLGLENARLVEELEHSNRHKTYLAATMSHELRGALNIMLLGGDELLTGTDALPSTVRESLTVLTQQARESVDLIDATLEMYGSEARRTDERDEIVVADLIDEVAREIAVSWKRAGVTTEWHVAADLPLIRTDPVKLKMILKNLVANAIKYTERGTVRVRVSAENAGVSFAVRDTGIGIPREELPTIFEPFRQAHGVTNHRAGSSGLGLYIVRRLVDMLGGTIHVESEVGRGSTFRAWIPLAYGG